MHVALHRGYQKASCRATAFGKFECLVIGECRILHHESRDIACQILRFIGFHIREKPGDRFLHHAGGFHHLRKKHFPRSEKIANDPHAIHQGSLDDF